MQIMHTACTWPVYGIITSVVGNPHQIFRGVAQLASAPRLGRGGRRFKSSHPDHDMSKQTTIYLVRHGESEFNKQSLITGHLDPPLTEEGKRQAQAAKLNLGNIKFDAVYTSDLERAVHTGEIIYGSRVPMANRLPNLRERNFGSLDGKPSHTWDTVSAIKKRIPHYERVHYKHVPDMESDHEMTERFIAALKKVAGQNRGKTILVVAHGGAIRTALVKMLGLTDEEMPPGSIGNAGFAELIYKNNGFEVKKIKP